MGIHRWPKDVYADRVRDLQGSSLDPTVPSPGNLLGGKVGSSYLWTPVVLSDLGLAQIMGMQPHQFVAWSATGSSTAIDVDNWTTTAVAFATQQTILGGISINFGDALTSDIELQVWTAAGGTGTLVATASMRDTSAGSNTRISASFGPQAMFSVAANTAQTYYLRLKVLTTTPVVGFTLDGQGTKTACGVLYVPA